MKRSVLFRLLSMLLVFAMLVELLPAGAFAAPDGEETPSAVQEGLLPESDESEGTDEQDVDTTEAEKLQEEACVVGEVMELREEGVKHFRMDDGSFIAVDYGMPVHFSTDGGESWEPIDNTLVLTDAEATVAEQGKQDNSGAAIQRYSSSNGDKRTTFASDLQSGFLFSAENGDHKICMSLPVVTDDRSEATGLEDIDSSDEVILELLTEDTETDESSEPDELEPSDNSVAPTEAAEEETEDQKESEAPMVAEEDLDETAGDTANVEANAETNTAEAFNTAASAEVSYPQDQQKQPDRGNPEEENSNDYASRSLEEQVMPSRLITDVLYRDVYDGVDLSYELCGYDVKENIVVKSRRDSYSFTFHLNTGDLVPIMQEDGSILFVDSEEQGIYLIPVPYMYDAEGVNSDAVSYSLSEAEEATWALTVTADADWINDENRFFPVTIDPTIIDQRTWTANNEDFYVTYVAEGLPNTTHWNQQQVDLGYSSFPDSLDRWVYIGWGELPPIPSGNEVVAAEFRIGQEEYSNDGISSFVAEMHALDSNVTRPSNYNSNYSWFAGLTWNNKPALDSMILDYTVLSSAQNMQYVSWDITELVKSWYLNSPSVKATCIKMESGSYYGGHCAAVKLFGYGHGYGPLFIVAYCNVEGIEDYYTYEALGADRAGSAYISDATGYLTTVTPLASLSSDINPFSINLVYNSSYFVKYNSNYDVAYNLGLTGMHFGSGMKLDIIQKMETINLQYEAGNSTTKKYLKYTDGDGTAHYFAVDMEKDPSGNTYYDEDGLGLKAVIDNENQGKFTVTNDKDAKMVFINKFLSYIEDANGNKIKIVYNANNGNPSSTAQISSVQQINKNQAPVTVATFGYSSVGGVSNYMTSMADYAGNFYFFQYASGKLRYISRRGYDEPTNADPTQIVEFFQKYENGTHNNPVTGLRDLINGYDLWFTYDGTNHGRINSYYEQVGNTKGARATITRVLGEKTTYTDWGNDRTYNTADDIITTYLFDNAGRTANIVTRTKDGAVVGAENAVYSGNGDTDKTNNRILRSASIGKAAMRIIRNGSFESSDSAVAWTISKPNLATNLANAVIAENKTRTGKKAFKTYLASGRDGFFSARNETFNLKNYKDYTISAYVNTSGAYNVPEGKGVYLKVCETNGSNVQTSEVIDYKTAASIDDGWMRISLTFRPVNSTRHYVYLCVDGVPGYVYFDDAQLELGTAPSNFNLLENGGMEYWKYDWKTQAGGLPDFPDVDDNESIDGSYSAKIVGSPNSGKYIHQVVQLKQPSAQTYVLSGWAKANAVIDNVTTATGDDAAAKDGEKQFGLRVKLTYSDTSTPEYHYVPFNPDVTDWQFASLAVVPKRPNKTVASADVICTYEKNANTVYFDNISLVREVAQTMTYDNDGNLTSVKSTGNSSENRNYENGNLRTVSSSGSNTYTYDYDDYHNLMSASNGVVKETYEHDSLGNTISTQLTQADGNGKAITSSITYESTLSKNLIKKDTDVRNNVTSYTYGQASVNKVSSMLGLPITVTNAKGVVTHYSYHNDGRPKSSYISNRISVNKTYDARGWLSSVNRGGYLPDGTTKLNQYYNFAYDEFGNNTQISVGSRNLVSYTYADHNGLLTNMNYGNADNVVYSYDQFGRKTQVTYNTENASNQGYDFHMNYYYKYTGDGQLYEMNDDYYNLTYRYTYDTIGRLIGSEEKNNTSTVLQTWHSYDDHDRITDQSWKLLDKTYKEEYTYDTNERLTQKKITLPNNSSKTIQLSYGESLGRLGTVTTPVSIDYINYLPGSGSNTTSSLVSAYSHNKVNNNSLSPFSFQYEYDELGNITKTTKKAGTTVTGIEQYTYDDQGQLTSVNRDSHDYDWNCVYDCSGNLRSKVYREAYLEKEELSYTYANTGWRDLLTSISISRNGGTATSHSFAYDTIGNPTTYYNVNNDASWTLGWINGRSLRKATGNGTTVNYTYDADALRLSKTVGGINHQYTYAGGQLLQESYTTTGGFVYTLDFVYDQNSRPFMLYYTETDPASGSSTYIYYYLLNHQGDVVRLVNANGATIANYDYDAWGRLLSVTDSSGNVITSSSHIANINPLRYRGYYYDTETGWYYLQSRYYDPAIGRFINADSYISTGQGFIGCNMFAYALNNPIRFNDQSGEAVGIDDAIYVAAFVVAVGIMAIGYYMTTPPAQRSLNSFVVAVHYSLQDIITTIKPLIVVQTAITAIVTVSHTSSRSSSSLSSTRTRYLADVRADGPSRNAKVYQLAYINKNNELVRTGMKVSYEVALFWLHSPDYIGKMNSKYGSKSWGIYTYSQAYAKYLAMGVGNYRPPEVHSSGQYGHYNCGNTHIWFGGRIWY